MEGTSEEVSDGKLLKRRVKGASENNDIARVLAEGAYDSDPLDYRLATEYGIELITPHRYGRRLSKVQDGRAPVQASLEDEAVFAWLQNFRCIQVRDDYYSRNFLGFVQLGCMMILLRRCL